MSLGGGSPNFSVMRVAHFLQAKDALEKSALGFFLEATVSRKRATSLSIASGVESSVERTQKRGAGSFCSIAPGVMGKSNGSDNFCWFRVDG